METKKPETVDVPLDLRRGNAVKVYQKFVDGKKERIVAFQGKILKSRGAGDVESGGAHLHRRYD